MCRSINTLYNFAQPATEAEIRASSLQFVRKLSGFTGALETNAPRAAAKWIQESAREIQDPIRRKGQRSDDLAIAVSKRFGCEVGPIKGSLG